MPTLWAHGQYFNTSSTAVAPTLAAGGGGYPLWQSGVISPSLFGGLHVYWERGVWWLGLLRRVWRLPRYLRGALDARLDGLLGPVATVQAMRTLPRRSILAWLTQPRIKRTVAAPIAPPELLTRMAVLLTHPAYPAAQAAVRKTARTLGFNRPEAWQSLSRQMKASPGYAENIYRHMQACQWTKAAAASTVSNPDCNLLVELAYQEFAARGE